MLDTHASRSASKVQVRRTTDEAYRHYRLIAGERGRGFSAVAYAGKAKVFTGSGSDLEAALDDLKTQIDSDFQLRKQSRIGELPSARELELALALAGRRISPAAHQLLHALGNGPEIDPRQIERRIDSDAEALLRDLVRLARAIAVILDVSLPKASGNAAAALDLVAEQIGQCGELDELWIFRSAFVEAVQAHHTR